MGSPVGVSAGVGCPAAVARRAFVGQSFATGSGCIAMPPDCEVFSGRREKMSPPPFCPCPGFPHTIRHFGAMRGTGSAPVENIVFCSSHCPCGGTGRRDRFKICCPQGRARSSRARGTIFSLTLSPSGLRSARAGESPGHACGLWCTVLEISLPRCTILHISRLFLTSLGPAVARPKGPSGAVLPVFNEIIHHSRVGEGRGIPQI